MHAPKLAMLVGSLAISMVSFGCATLSNNAQGLSVIGPPNVKVENVQGGELHSTQDKNGITVYPDPAVTDSVRIVYGSQFTTIALAKNPNTFDLFNAFAFGLPFFVDDMDNKWFNYAPVYVTVDSSANELRGISASSEDWLRESPGLRNIQALLLLGTGFAGQTNATGPIPLPFTGEHISTYALTFQAGIGVDYRKTIELFYLFRIEPSYDLSNTVDNSETDIETAQIATEDICLRYFFQKNFFLQRIVRQSVRIDIK